MKVLSLFDGCSGGQESLNQCGIKYSKYYASEIKKSAIKCTQYNYPNTIQLGDVTLNDFWGFKLGDIDLLLGGSPCQDLSIAKKNGDGLHGNKSKLFFEFLNIKENLKPRYFLLENVKMNKESEKIINEYLGVEGIHINSKLLSFQKRPRIYWTNIPFEKNIQDTGVSFQDYIGIGDLEEAKVNKTPSRLRMWNDGNGRTNIKACDNITNSEKIGCLLRKQDRAPNSGLIEYKDFCRYLTRRELEASQGFKYGYTDCLSYNQVQDVMGDGWNIPTINHILKNLRYLF